MLSFSAASWSTLRAAAEAAKANAISLASSESSEDSNEESSSLELPSLDLDSLSLTCFAYCLGLRRSCDWLGSYDLLKSEVVTSLTPRFLEDLPLLWKELLLFFIAFSF
tara:strand:+ start:105 stop:431 length:327 start_codon:yes stop_codon:yes gene_type:complete